MPTFAEHFAWEAMSSRWYPIYQKGNPQLRVFLPNFWMKMVKPDYNQYGASTPANKVTSDIQMQEVISNTAGSIHRVQSNDEAWREELPGKNLPGKQK